MYHVYSWSCLSVSILSHIHFGGNMWLKLAGNVSPLNRIVPQCIMKYLKMYVLPPKACTTCPWLPLIWNPRGTPVSGSSNSRLSPPLRSEQRRNIYFLLLNALIKELILYNAGKYRVSQKKLLKKCWARNHTKSGNCGDKFSHGHNFGALDHAWSLLRNDQKNALL